MAESELVSGPAGENHASQVQVMSALVKTVRLRRVDDAVYWFTHFAKFFPDQKFRLSRRLLIIAAEDNLCVPVQVQAMEWFAHSLGKDNKKWYNGAVSLLHLICATQNWWEDPAGAHHILAFRRAERIFKDSSDLGKKMLAKEPVPLDDPGKALLVHFAKQNVDDWSVCGDGQPGDKDSYALWLMEEARKRGMLSARMTALVHHRWAKFLTFDDNYLSQAVYKIVYGLMGYRGFPGVSSEVVAASVTQAKARLQSPEKPPSWTQDGIHTGGSDRRFAGMYMHMVACCNAYRVYGRLHPDDEHTKEMFSTTQLFERLKLADPSLSARGLPFTQES